MFSMKGDKNHCKCKETAELFQNTIEAMLQLLDRIDPADAQSDINRTSLMRKMELLKECLEKRDCKNKE